MRFCLYSHGFLNISIREEEEEDRKNEQRIEMVEKPKLCGCSMNDAGLCHFISVRCIIEINQINVTLCRIVICSFGYLQFKVFRRSAATHNMTISWCVRVECVRREKKHTQRRIHIVRKISKQYLARVSVHSTKLCYDLNEFFILGFGCGFKSTCWIRQRYFWVTWSCNVFLKQKKNLQKYAAISWIQQLSLFLLNSQVAKPWIPQYEESRERCVNINGSQHLIFQLE